MTTSSDTSSSQSVANILDTAGPAVSSAANRQEGNIASVLVARLPQFEEDQGVQAPPLKITTENVLEEDITDTVAWFSFTEKK